MTINDPAEDILAIFDRRTPIDALDALTRAIENSDSLPKLELSKTAIGLDANVFLRLQSHPKGTTVVDYLIGLHEAPLILPGQSIQEFWNNQTEAITTVGKKLKSNFTNFKKAVNNIDDDFGDYLSQIENLLDQFFAEHGNVYEEKTLRDTISVLKNLKRRAIVPFCPREKYLKIAQHRNDTKTPPGFMDSGDGDFFVWADFLYGLKKLQHDGVSFERVVMVTNEKKKDWSRDGVAHPILAAELNALLGVPFETWSMDKLCTQIEADLSATESTDASPPL